MSIGRTNFDIDQGSDFILNMSLLDADNDPIDLTGAQILGQLRKTASSETVEAEFDFVPVNLANGEFIISLSASKTSQLKMSASFAAERTITQYAYDVKVIYSDGSINRILSGVVNVSPEVTRI
jgi:hypothetical protein